MHKMWTRSRACWYNEYFDHFIYFFLFSRASTCFTTTLRSCYQATARSLIWKSVCWWNLWCSSVTSSKTLQSRRPFSMSWWLQWFQTGPPRRWGSASDFSLILLLISSSVPLWWRINVLCPFCVLQGVVWPCCVPVLRRRRSGGQWPKSGHSGP